MATKQFTALKDFRYGTRRLRAGDDVDMIGRDAKLFLALQAVAPRVARPVAVAKPKAAPRKVRKAAKKK